MIQLIIQTKDLTNNTKQDELFVHFDIN